jgi:hypothetical protein
MPTKQLLLSSVQYIYKTFVHIVRKITQFDRRGNNVKLKQLRNKQSTAY